MCKIVFWDSLKKHTPKTKTDYNDRAHKNDDNTLS